MIGLCLGSSRVNANRKLIARRLFRLRVYEATKTEFQSLFERVMQYREAGFIKIKPYGNVGDRKNDGYTPDRHRSSEMIFRHSRSQRTITRLSRMRIQLNGS